MAHEIRPKFGAFPTTASVHLTKPDLQRILDSLEIKAKKTHPSENYGDTIYIIKNALADVELCEKKGA